MKTKMVFISFALFTAACTSMSPSAENSRPVRGVAQAASGGTLSCDCTDEIYTGHYYESAKIDANQACRDANSGAPSNIVARNCADSKCDCTDEIYTGHYYNGVTFDGNQACRSANPSAPRNIVSRNCSFNQ